MMDGGLCSPAHTVEKHGPSIPKKKMDAKLSSFLMIIGSDSVPLLMLVEKGEKGVENS